MSKEDKIDIGFLKRHPNLMAMIMGSFFCLILLIIVETFLYFYMKHLQGEVTNIVLNFSSKTVILDKELGYKSPPKAITRSVFKVKDRVIFDVIYSHDELGRRITPSVPGKKYKDFCLFFGCSFTYGIGVNDHETMPAVFAKKMDLVRVYNYGYTGYGMQGMLAFLSRKSFADEIPEAKETSKGLRCGVYTYIDDQLLRAIGGMSSMYFGDSFPYYRLAENHEIIRVGNFDSERTFTTLIYKILAYSRLLRLLKFDLPLKITDEHIKFGALMIKKSRDLFQEKFHSRNFLVVFYPWSSSFADKLIGPLKDYGIEILDLRPYEKIWDPKELAIEVDGHPNVKGHEAVGNIIFETLKSRL